MTDRSLLRFAATLIALGAIVGIIAGILHAGRDPNNHVVEFTEYANSSTWTAVHLGQFVGIAFIIAGLIVLYFALDLQTGLPAWAARFGAICAGIALALYGALQAVDGVALKQAVDAWANAPDSEKTIRFASAEAIRWLEWGFRSYHSYVLGVAFLLFAAAILSTARMSKVVGSLIAVSGLAYVAQGWVLGSEGFSAANTLPTLIGIVSILAWASWFFVSVWREQKTLPVTTAQM